jgi:DNA-binding FadR family transcriptional regulator
MAFIKDSHQVILAKLKKFLEDGKLVSQGRLPSERALAIELGIPRSALRKAMMVLQEEGLIWRHVGRGTFIGPKPEAIRTQEALSSVTSVTNPAEIMEARILLEPKLAALAALRVSLNEISQMEIYIQKAQEANKTEQFEHWDEQLHLAIAQATDNNLLISLFMVIHKIKQSNIWGKLKEASLTSERQKIYHAQHREIVDALKYREASRAENLMREHLETIKSHLLEVYKFA